MKLQNLNESKLLTLIKIIAKGVQHREAGTRAVVKVDCHLSLSDSLRRTVIMTFSAMSSVPFSLVLKYDSPLEYAF